MSLDILAAKQAITEVIYRYCRAFDRMDHEMALTIWHPDGTCNYTGKAGTPDILARDYFGPSEAARAKMRNHSHQVSNILIEVSGDRAASESVFAASLQIQPEHGKIIEHLYRGRYLDKWSKRDGVWAIDHRQVVFDSYTPYEFSVDRLANVPLDLTQRNKTDPSYALFAWLGKK